MFKYTVNIHSYYCFLLHPSTFPNKCIVDHSTYLLLATPSIHSSTQSLQLFTIFLPYYTLLDIPAHPHILFCSQLTYSHIVPRGSTSSSTFISLLLWLIIFILLHVTSHVAPLVWEEMVSGLVISQHGYYTYLLLYFNLSSPSIKLLPIPTLQLCSPASNVPSSMNTSAPSLHCRMVSVRKGIQPQKPCRSKH